MSWLTEPTATRTTAVRVVFVSKSKDAGSATVITPVVAFTFKAPELLCETRVYRIVPLLVLAEMVPSWSPSDGFSSTVAEKSLVDKGFV